MNTDQMKEMMTMVYKIMASDEFCEALADMMWKIYEKLKSKGFTDEQAMSIALHFAKTTTSSEDK